MNLVGEFGSTLDSKGRFLFPAGLRRQLAAGEDVRFVINRGFEQCLVLYTAQEWKQISDELNQLNLFIKKNREFVRYFYRGATELLMDGSGRLLIPKDLQQYASLSKDITLFAFSNRIEIWDSGRYGNLLADEPEEFSTLAEEVMSKKEAKNHGDIS
jgi:MraZ protein